jgi:hypothetical protein
MWVVVLPVFEIHPAPGKCMYAAHPMYWKRHYDELQGRGDWLTGLGMQLPICPGFWLPRPQDWPRPIGRLWAGEIVGVHLRSGSHPRGNAILPEP